MSEHPSDVKFAIYDELCILLDNQFALTSAAAWQLTVALVKQQKDGGAKL
jgi:hypothetical protein